MSFPRMVPTAVLDHVEAMKDEAHNAIHARDVGVSSREPAAITYAPIFFNYALLEIDLFQKL